MTTQQFLDDQNKFKIMVLEPCTCQNRRYPVYITRRYEKKDMHGVVLREWTTHSVYCPLCKRYTAEKRSTEEARLDWNNGVVAFANHTGDFDSFPKPVITSADWEFKSWEKEDA